MSLSEPMSVLSELEQRLKDKFQAIPGVSPRIYISGNNDLRTEIRGWLLAQGIKPEKVRKAQDETLEKAFSVPDYLNKMRYDIRTGRRDDAFMPAQSVNLDTLDDGYISPLRPSTPPDLYTPQSPIRMDPSTGLPEEKQITISPAQLAAVADQVLSARINQARDQLSKSIDEKIANAKLSLSDEAKRAIKDLARDSAQALIQELMPPKRLEICDTRTGTITDLGIQHFKFETLLRSCQARDKRGNRLNIWLTGPTGSGKTTAGENVAKALGLEFGADGSLDADYKVVGFKDAHGAFHTTTFLERFSKGGIYIADEIDNWLPSALLSLNAALAQGWIFTPNGVYKRHPDCVIIACANTWGLGATNEYVGRTKLDAASLNRFQPKIDWPIDEEMERAIASASGGKDWCDLVQMFRQRAKTQGLHVIISPRDTFNGISLLEQGFTKNEVTEMTFAAGLKPEQRQALGIS